MPIPLPIRIGQYFSELDSLLETKNQFWNIELYGPILLIDPYTRVFYANQNDNRESFISVHKIFQGILPDHIPIANTAFEWDSLRWTMFMLPVSELSEDRNKLIIHELFHRVQPELGFESLNQLSTAHLDSRVSREWLRLELVALLKTLNEPAQEDRHNTSCFGF